MIWIGSTQNNDEKHKAKGEITLQILKLLIKSKL